MCEQDILDVLARIHRDKLDGDGEVRRDQRLIEDLRLDSLQLLTLAVEIEDHFRIAIEEEDEAVLETVGDLTDLVLRKASGSPGSPIR